MWQAAGDPRRQIADLRSRQDEFRELLANAQVRPPTPADLAALTQQLRATIQTGPAPARKALIGALVHEVRVTSRAAIIPVFRVPSGQPPHGKVRAMSSLGARDRNRTCGLLLRRQTLCSAELRGPL